MIIEEGFKISQHKINTLVRLERNRFKESYLDIYYEPGVMCQFDWGQKKITVSDKKQKICFAVFALPYSNYRFVYATKKMDGKAFVEAFTAFIKHMNGIFPKYSVFVAE